MKKDILKFVIFFVISFFLILIDQFTKNLALLKLKNNEPFTLIDGILELTYVENSGAAFGILKGQQYLFFVLTIIVFLFILFFLYKISLNKHYFILYLFLVLLFSGAMGNFIDRLKNKYVIDFIYFKLIDFPVFNVADCYITISCIMMVVSLFTIYKKDDLFL